MRRRLAKKLDTKPGFTNPVGGTFEPLSTNDVDQITDAALSVLSEIGMAGLPEQYVSRFCQAGAMLNSHNRVCFPESMVREALHRAPSTVTVPGFKPDSDIVVGDRRVHVGTGGAAIQVLDADTMQYRDSTLNDLYELMRAVNELPYIRYGLRPVIARDVEDPFELDINTAFACVKATHKPIGVSFHTADSVDAVASLCDMALGANDSFKNRPFCLGIVVHVVPPLRFATETIDVLEACLQRGVIPQLCSAGQAGATSPVTLAGALAQGLAETLAGLLLVDLIKPGANCIHALMPFISDLRTGAMSGGSGECAVANAAAAQLLSSLGLPSTVSAGMTDSKRADIQAGYEKGYSIAMAAQAGANMINLSVGMLGSIMVASSETMVIDNDMCGAILRSVQGIDVNEQTLDINMIKRVVTGDGHYLGAPETLQRMKTDYYYPSIGDRRSVDEWLEAGEPNIWDVAKAKVQQIAAIQPTHLAAEEEQAIRSAFPIHLKQ